MPTKGTGWIPDFPDVKDYTLNSGKIKGLTSQVQTEHTKESVESLTAQVAQAIELLQHQSTAGGELSNSSRELNSLIENFNKKASGGVHFVTAKINRTLKSGMFGPEVIKIKRDLIALFPNITNEKYGFRLDQSFDELTKLLIERFQEERGLPANGVVDAITMRVLNWAVYAKDQDLSEYAVSTLHRRIPFETEKIQEARTKLEEYKSRTEYNQEGIKEFDDPSDLLLLTHDIEDCVKLIRDEFERKNSLTPKINLFFDLTQYSVDYASKYKTLSDIKNALERIQNNDLLASTEDISLIRENIHYIVSQLSDNFLEIPYFLLPSFTYDQDEIIEDITVPIPMQVAEIVLKELISSEVLNALLTPVPLSSIFQMIHAPSQGIYLTSSTSEIAASRYLTQNLRNLRHQLQLVGISLQEFSENFHEIANGHTQRDIEETLSKFQKKYNVHSNISRHFQDPKYLDFVPEQLCQVVKERINELISPISRLVVEFLIPLSQHSNLEQSIVLCLGEINSFLKTIKQGRGDGIGTIQADDSSLLLKNNHSPLITVKEFVDSLKRYLSEQLFEQAMKRSIEALERLVATNSIISLEIIEFEECIQKFYRVEKFDDRNMKDAIGTLEDILQRNNLGKKVSVIVENVIRLMRKPWIIELNSDQGKLNYSGDNPIYAILCNYLNKYPIGDIFQTLDSFGQKKTNQEHELRAKNKSQLDRDNASSNKPLLELTDFYYESDPRTDVQVLITWPLYKDLQEKINGPAGIYLRLPDFLDLSLWCSSIEDQGSLNSCTAQAGVALIEYFAKRKSGKYVDVSSLFLYKAARNLMQRQGDTGVSVRETMKAMVLFGIPPEEHWPYDEEKFDEEPTSFCYSFAQNYQALKYFRIDYAGLDNDTLLIQIKSVLVAGFPCMFGFTIYTSIYDEVNMKKGHVPYPSQFDRLEGGHAVVAVGYDDHYIIGNTDSRHSQGAILIRNSWGNDWGLGGYGWLPYDYILAGLTADWWSLFQSEWFESGQFGAGTSQWASNVGAKEIDRPR